MTTMKKNLLNFILLFVLSALTIQSQTNVNREWQENSGTPVINPFVNPAGLDWYSSITNSLGQIITTGHTNVSGQGENLYLKKLSATGAVIFTVTFNSSGTNNDYGIALTQDASNNIYVVGTTDNGGTTNYNVLLLKYNASGVLQFSVTYAGPAGLNDIGTSIKRDASGNIFVACSSEGTSTSYDYRLNKYSPTGTLLWSSTYNFVSLIDVPLGLTINGNTVSVNGTSASSATKWDYCNANFNATTGTFQSATRTNIPGVGFDQPYAFVKDASQNIYLTGRNSTTGTNYNIFTVKISPTYSLMWTQFYDLAGQDDLGSDIDVDASGNIIVGGFTTKSNGIKQATLLKYNPSGTLLWQYHQAGKKETADASITGLCVNSNSDAYFVAGETGASNLQEVLVGKIKSTGVIAWERSIASPQNNVPAKINLNPDGTIIVTSLRKGSPDTYQTTKYSEFETPTGLISTSSGRPFCKKSELIVRFLPSALNIAALDNQIGTKISEYGNLSDFMTVAAYSIVTTALNKLCPGGRCDFKAIKIFRDFPSTYITTTSRLGTSVKVPDFWATLRVILPTGLTVQQARTAFDNIPNVVGYAHPNYYGVTNSIPNDSLYTSQKSLYASVSYPNAGINVEEAWDVFPQGGQPFVKGGVYDSGIHWQHRDFGYDGVNSSSSKIAGGWDFGTNTPLKSITAAGDGYNHGTPCAGIIGSIRNNTSGIAGIAGGNYTVSSNLASAGVSLYGFRLYDGNGVVTSYTYNNIPVLLSDFAAAIRNSATDNLNTSPYSFGMHFMNNSWGLSSDTVNGNFSFVDTNIVMLNEVVRYANRLNVTFVASRGNFYASNKNEINYPACYDDDWVLSVGGTGTDGNYMHSNNLFSNFPINGEASVYYGNNLDIAAPSSSNMVTSLSSSGGYKVFNGTSASAPHVSGVVGLLMSYMNDPTGNPNYKNLAPEDCEFILQKTATDADSVGYDVFSGYGRLNAGKAMRLVEKPYRFLYHFGTNPSSGCSFTKTKTLFSNNDTVVLTERYQNQVQTWFKKGRYIVKTYKVSATINHNFGFVTDSTMYYWPRHSGSSVLELFSGTKKKLRPHEKVTINSFNANSASLSGYIYQVKDTLGNPLGWWPFDTTLTNMQFEYSVLAKNKAVGIQDKYEYQNAVTLYPNPANHLQTLVIESDKIKTITVQLYDLMGRLIRNIYDGKATGEKTVISVDVGSLPPTMYLYKIKLDDTFVNKRFIKN